MASRKKILIVGASSLVGNDLFKNFKKNYDIIGTYHTNQNQYIKGKIFIK